MPTESNPCPRSEIIRRVTTNVSSQPPYEAATMNTADMIEAGNGWKNEIVTFLMNLSESKWIKIEHTQSNEYFSYCCQANLVFSMHLIASKSGSNRYEQIDDVRHWIVNWILMYWNVQYIVHVFRKAIVDNCSRPIVKCLQCTNYRFCPRVSILNFHLQLPRIMQVQVYLSAWPSMVSTSRLSYHLTNSLPFLTSNIIFLLHWWTDAFEDHRSKISPKTYDLRYQHGIICIPNQAE